MFMSLFTRHESLRTMRTRQLTLLLQQLQLGFLRFSVHASPSCVYGVLSMLERLRRIPCIYTDARYCGELLAYALPHLQHWRRTFHIADIACSSPMLCSDSSSK